LAIAPEAANGSCPASWASGRYDLPKAPEHSQSLDGSYVHAHELREPLRAAGQHPDEVGQQFGVLVKRFLVKHDATAEQLAEHLKLPLPIVEHISETEGLDV
jgi:hypothetical protein